MLTHYRIEHLGQRRSREGNRGGAMSACAVSDIVESLEAKGVRFRLEGEKIKAKLPAATPTEVLQTLETLRPQRAELAVLLRERPSPVSAPTQCPPLPPGVPLLSYKPKQ